MDRCRVTDARPRQIRQRAIGRHGHLRASGTQVRRHTVHNGHHRPGDFELIEFERHRKERSITEVKQVTSRQIPPVIAAAIHNFS